LLAFVHIEKAAGITVNHIMRREFGMSHCDVEPCQQHNDYFSKEDLRRLRLLYPRLKSIAGHRVKPYSDLVEVCPEIRYYTLLREPVARCASHYQFQIQQMKRNVPFEEWIVQDKFRNFQVKKLVGRDDLEAAIRQVQEGLVFTGMMERFDESMVLLRHRVKDFRPLDIKLYEFVSQELYPQFQRAYGDSLDADVAAFKASNRVASVRLTERMNWLKRNLLYKPALSCIRVAGQRS
jgi:hypothetical protein